MVLLTHSTSLYLLTAISLERCLCVLWPFSYQCHHLGLLSFVLESCLLLASINSSVNPVIHVLVGCYGKSRFRGSVKVALERVFEEKIDP
ncbi:mas-related G-protein coupled receptor member H-like [Nothoprocta perdicaria]|uniref:mas-related G-protein coupled receptor member H-like n=1 Tax=Nothoprocta perdicaria TaxID=30464 RepID=UPI000E1B5AA0|nr:mas-related G-protein coupled receptor member H-like [Nothoprocta perdicaria]